MNLIVVGMMTSTTVRNHIFPILIAELVKEYIMSAADSNLVTNLFAQVSASASYCSLHL